MAGRPAVAMRVIFQAVTMAFTQVVLARLVIAWMGLSGRMTKDLGLAIEHTFARWRGVAGLAVLDLLILLLQSTSTSGRGLLFWVLLEVMVLFLLFPVAVARVQGIEAGWPRCLAGSVPGPAFLRCF